MKYFETTIFNQKVYVMLMHESFSRLMPHQNKIHRRTKANYLHSPEESIVLACKIDDKIEYFYGEESLIKKIEENKNLIIEWKFLDEKRS